MMNFAPQDVEKLISRSLDFYIGLLLTNQSHIFNQNTWKTTILFNLRNRVQRILDFLPGPYIESYQLWIGQQFLIGDYEHIQNLPRPLITSHIKSNVHFRSCLIYTQILLLFFFFFFFFLNLQNYVNVVHVKLGSLWEKRISLIYIIEICSVRTGLEEFLH